jgi:hypothetical protein
MSQTVGNFNKQSDSYFDNDNKYSDSDDGQPY